MHLLNENLKDNKICLSYFGTFSDEITDKLIGISEFYLEHKTELGKLKNKVSFLIAECFQNIVRHGDVNEKIKSFNHPDFFQFNVMDDRIILTSCNLIENKYIEDLEKKLIQVNSLTGDELKKLYNELLENGGFSNKGGAGLGLIDMARKSGLPLKYLFKEIENGVSQFFLLLEIINKKEITEEKIQINDIEQFYQFLSKDNILILYKGDFSIDTIIPLIDMLQYNFNADKTLSGKERQRIITMIETLQNISKHGKRVNETTEGVFTIRKTDNNYTLEVGNFIDEINCKKLEENLSSIKGMNLDEISNLYKKRLMETELTREGNCGLGLLEIARNSNNNFSYDFVPTLENELFYTIKIAI